MTVHYHGTPISPRAELLSLAGRSFCVSFARPDDVKACHEIGQSVMLDNGAFSAWRSGRAVDWQGYYRWAERWLDYRTTWAVIPDVIDGDAWDNDQLIDQWPHGERGAPVWHLHERIDRLTALCDRFPRVCIGSSGAYSAVGSFRWHHRMSEAMNALCGDGPAPVWLHMLRGMAVVGGGYPFASVDSTDVGQNHKRPENTAAGMVARWDRVQSPARWQRRAIQMTLEPGDDLEVFAG